MYIALSITNYGKGFEHLDYGSLYQHLSSDLPSVSTKLDYPTAMKLLRAYEKATGKVATLEVSTRDTQIFYRNISFYCRE